MSTDEKFFITSSVCGFCRGVRRAISCFDDAHRKYGQTVYVLHELVHNNFVTQFMQQNGAVFVDDVNDIPDGAVAMIGAHGVDKNTWQEMQKRFTVVDATCPRVKALQKFASGVGREQELVMLCKKGHPEAVGVLGHAGTEHIYPVSDIKEASELPELKNPVFLSQTTVSGTLAGEVETLLRERFGNLKSHGCICDASNQRQRGVEVLAEHCQVVLVVGSSHSSNAVELVKTAERCGKKAWLVDNGNSVLPDMLANISIVGITAGASTPDELIEDVQKRLISMGYHNKGICNV